MPDGSEVKWDDGVLSTWLVCWDGLMPKLPRMSTAVIVGSCDSLGMSWLLVLGGGWCVGV